MKKNINKIVAVMLIVTLVMLSLSVLHSYNQKKLIAELEARVFSLESIIEKGRADNTAKEDEATVLPDPSTGKEDSIAELGAHISSAKLVTEESAPRSTYGGSNSTKPPAADPPSTPSGSDDGVGSDAGEAGLD